MLGWSRIEGAMLMPSPQFEARDLNARCTSIQSTNCIGFEWRLVFWNAGQILNRIAPKTIGFGASIQLNQMVCRAYHTQKCSDLIGDLFARMLAEF
jgi:hypothetical protein